MLCVGEAVQNHGEVQRSACLDCNIRLAARSSSNLDEKVRRNARGMLRMMNALLDTVANAKMAGSR